ncbi:hypothetical protein LTR36_010867 [Oleoguttula mirabilis]|uniref:Thioredoxin-like protein AAED1 n=1 Tax=Oleoguttula mirabilis TaxID=1507867 RepID=A0AAV9J5E3_9PEZI|nr:hypothetical protein LTR36_010867 [Oleoguttula mirabilis]
MARDRSVSPVGASRFERPYAPPSRTASKKRNSPTSPTSTSTSANTMSFSHASQPSSASTMQSSTTAPSSADTAPSSADTSPRPPTTPSHHKPAIIMHSPARSFPSAASDADPDTDDWFARFRSDPDLSLARSDDCPDRATLAAVYDLPIYQSDGTAQPFGSLYDPAYALHQRQLVLFVRHFYCGACQAYLQALSTGITKEDYFGIPVPTSIFVIGCGKPDLIPTYKKMTGCPFPIFADPSRQLFKKLGMSVSMNIGAKRPEYMAEISAPRWAYGQVTTIRKSLKDPDGIRKRDIVRGGNMMQIGGEFLFDEGEVVWCHRMRNYRNHAEVAVLRKLLELDE